MMAINFEKLVAPTPEIAQALNRWANDPVLVPLTRPNRDKATLEQQQLLTVESLIKSLEHHTIYLIYADGQLVGEMNFSVDPAHLYRNTPGTAWIGIGIGEAVARGKGVGTRAMQYLEEQIRAQGLKRIELGVFEFNKNAIQLYKKMGYQEIGRIDDFTYWNDKMWQDIRMEKYLTPSK